VTRAGKQVIFVMCFKHTLAVKYNNTYYIILLSVPYRAVHYNVGQNGKYA